MKGRMRDEYDSYLEEKKIEFFDIILDIYQDKELTYQKRASMILSILSEYLDYKAY